MVAFFVPPPFAAPLGLTQKGYGYAQGASSTSNLTLNYGTVSSGSAPVAGDLVVWIVCALDSASQAINDLTGSGWGQARRYSSPICSSVLAKVVVAGDVSAPPTGVSAPTDGSVAMWVSYAIAGGLSTLTVNNHDLEYAGTTAPGSDLQNSSGLSAGAYSITVAFGTGTDDTIGLNWSGATPDVSLQRTNFESTVDVKFGAAAVRGGANITISKDDDGAFNSLASAYVSVT